MAQARLTGLMDRAQQLFPGLLVAAVIALASEFIAEHYGAPAILLALLFGMAMNFLSAEEKTKPGIAFGSKTVLRLGVALLGVRITTEVLSVLGVQTILLVVSGTILTIGFGLVASRFFGFKYRFAFLSSGAVAICGASAAMAIAAILPKDERSEERLIFTVVGVTLLSTVAMITYPILTDLFQLDHRTTGIFIGATIHDVAQVVGAGFSVSEETGNVATLVKLLRVLMLAPIVLVASLVIRSMARSAEVGEGRPPLVPLFVMGFIVLAVLSSLGWLPASVTAFASAASRWLLLTAIAAVGMKTMPKDIANVGASAALFLVAETVFLAVYILIGLTLLPGL
ncbi:YeiH family protein [Palleronia caenipelagi]|uniref:Putative sulfate exporter family transporter n=1 Tax=Palleronia caenipelagi TaxID=2489174 RepID=A0A547Q026_9RHOB|nr:putative sulfate exporter family transporter [Palleronia caenipelagi]TRD19746.1 putative sulfate exporter family transporter [Palleronia caenipelagi]